MVPKPFSATIDALPQEVLLLHELETFFKFVAPGTSGAVLNVIMPKVRELHVVACRIFVQVRAMSTLAKPCSRKFQNKLQAGY